jgi:hypothetical protein
MAKSYDTNKDTQIQINNPTPGTTPTQVLALGPYGIIDATNTTVVSFTSQAAPAIILPAVDPHVAGAIWNNSNTVTVSGG